jgi:hypothetical protein
MCNITTKESQPLGYCVTHVSMMPNTTKEKVFSVQDLV